VNLKQQLDEDSVVLQVLGSESSYKGNYVGRESARCKDWDPVCDSAVWLVTGV